MGYAYRATVIIPAATGSTLTNFTAVIKGTNNLLRTVANGGVVQNTVSRLGQTVPADLILSSDAAGTTLYNWGVDSYDPVNGSIYIWVLIPSLPYDSNTLIYINFGNSAVNTYQGGAAGSEYASSIKSVYHFGDGTTLNINDASSNANNGIINNNVTAVTGKISGAASFVRGSSSYISTTNVINIAKPVLACWVNLPIYPAASTKGRLFGFSNGSHSATEDKNLAIDPTGKVYFYCYDVTNGIQQERVTTSATIPLNTWTHITITVDTTIHIYINGVEQTTTIIKGSDPVGNLFTAYTIANFYLGDSDQNGYVNATFLLDEVYIGNTLWSANWISTLYSNQLAPATISNFTTNYTYTSSVTIPAASGSTLTNFTAAFTGSSVKLKTAANGGAIQNTVTRIGQTVPADLIVTTDAAGLSLCNWGVDAYDGVNGTITIWVLIPNLTTSASVTLYILFGNSAVSTFLGGSQGSEFDTYTKGVYHLGDGTTLNAKDFSSGANDGTLTNTPTSGSGKLGGAGSFVNASNQKITGSGINLANGAFSVSCWLNPSSSSAGRATAGLGSVQSNNQLIHLRVVNNTSFTFGMFGDDLTTIPYSFTNGNWYNIYCTLSGTKVQKLYVNGVTIATRQSTGFFTGNTNWVIGWDNIGATEYWDGKIDEVNYSALARSADWVATAYSNQNSPPALTGISATPLFYDTITVNETFVKKPLRLLVDIVTISDTVAKLPKRALPLETLTLSDANSKMPIKHSGEAFTIVETIIRKYFKSINDSINFIETFARKTNRSVAEVITLIEAAGVTPMITDWTYIRNFLSDPERIQ